MKRKAIRIIAIPSGEAPEDIRRAWVGIVLPVADVTKQELRARGLVSMGVLGGPPDPANVVGYNVKTQNAIAALRIAGKENAVAWWEENVFPDMMPYLIFGTQFCEECEI